MYKDAKKYHYRAGLVVEDEAVRSGLLKIRRRMCGCTSCSPPDFNFGQCMLKHVFGSVVSTYCPPKPKPRGALTQTQALVEFSESLVTNKVYVKVADAQTGAEGPYWLAKLSTRSYQNEEEYVFAGDVIEAGFIVVKVRGKANFTSPSPRPRPNDTSFQLCLVFLLGPVAVLQGR